MKRFCQNEHCDNPGAKVVPVSVDQPSDQKRTLCITCEEAYAIGVQHGTMVASARPALPDLAEFVGKGALRVTDRELATVLAALRFHQAENLQGGRDIPDQFVSQIATDGGLLKPLGFQEVDDLCERQNTEENQPAAKGLVIEPPHKEGGDEPLYRVVYVTDANAANPRGAAEYVRQVMMDMVRPDSCPPVLEVIDHRGKVVSVDLSQGAPA